jgi:hypothetical protein
MNNTKKKNDGKRVIEELQEKHLLPNLSDASC